MRYLFLLLGLTVLVVGCDDKSNPIRPGGRRVDMKIRVIDQDSIPVPGASVVCRIDWDSFSGITDGNGEVRVSANPDQYASIEKSGYLPLTLRGIQSGTYQIEATPYDGVEIGDVSGDLVDMNLNIITTITKDGIYRLYRYGHENVALRQEINTGIAVRNLFQVADTLWVYSMSDTLHGYVLQDGNLGNEVRVSPGYPGGIVVAVWDSLFVSRVDDDLFIYSVGVDGTIHQYYKLTASHPDEVHYRDGFLMVTDKRTYLKIYDVSDPRLTHQVYDLGESFYAGIFIRDADALVQYDPHGDSYGPTYGYVLDLGNLNSPEIAHGFSASSRIFGLIDDVTVLHGFEFPVDMVGLARMNSQHVFTTIYAVTHDWMNPFKGGFGDYIVIGNKLVRLKERIPGYTTFD